MRWRRRSAAPRSAAGRSRERRSAPDAGRGLLTLHRAVGNQRLGDLLRGDREVAPIERVSEPDEPAEREARREGDRMAETSAPSSPTPRPASTPASPTSRDAGDGIEKALGPGRPLGRTERGHFEPRLGVDLAGVRVHEDAAAARGANKLGARAFTVGRHIAFGAGERKSGTTEGRRLLGHELAHVARPAEGGAEAGATAMREPKPGSPKIPPLRTPGPLAAPGREITDSLTLLGADIPPPLMTRHGDTVALTVYFGQDDFLLDARSAGAVETMAAEIRHAIEPKITVDGHASTEGKEGHNLSLSQKRRELVVALLGAEADPKPKFAGSPLGETDLAVAETGKGKELDAQRARNRRVEIVMVPKPFVISPDAEEKDVNSFDPNRFRLQPGDMERIFPEWEEQRRNRERLQPPPDPPPREKWSLEGWADEKLDRLFDRGLKAVGVDDKETRKKWSTRLRDGVKAGGRKGLETIIDQAPVGSEGKDALKKIIEAAPKQDF